MRNDPIDNVLCYILSIKKTEALFVTKLKVSDQIRKGVLQFDFGKIHCLNKNKLGTFNGKYIKKKHIFRGIIISIYCLIGVTYHKVCSIMFILCLFNYS